METEWWHQYEPRHMTEQSDAHGSVSGEGSVEKRFHKGDIVIATEHAHNQGLFGRRRGHPVFGVVMREPKDDTRRIAVRPDGYKAEYSYHPSYWRHVTAEDGENA